MSVPRKSITPEAVAMARHLYEQTNVPMHDIAALLGISKTTLGLRVRLWEWTPRARRLPTEPPARLEPPGREEPPEAAAAAEPQSRGTLIARLMARIETEIASVERLLAQAGAARGEGYADGERAARTLAILVRSLRELAALEKQEPDGDDDASRDADAFRRELGQTLERVLAGGEAS